jgi:transcription initiation factor TFIIB
VLTASIYVALRQSGVPRTLDEISEISNVKLKHAARSYRRIVNQLDIKAPIIDPSKYIMKVANKLGFDEKIKRKALELMEQARKKNILVGKDPVSMASSILYLLSVAEGHNKTQSEIAKVAGTTEVTVRNRSKELRQKLGLD